MRYCGLDSAPIPAPPTHRTNRLRRVPDYCKVPGALVQYAA